MTQIVMPMNLDDVKAPVLLDVGAQEMKCIDAEIKEVKDSSDQCLVMSFQSSKFPKTSPVFNTIFFPKQAAIAGWKSGKGYSFVNPKNGETKSYTAEEAERQVNAQMRAIKTVAIHLKLPHTNTKDGASIDFGKCQGKLAIFNITLRPATYQDGLPHIDGTGNPEAPDPNAGRKMWPENRDLVWPELKDVEDK